MPSDLASDPALTIALCQTSHSRLLATVQGVTDDQLRGPSRLPGWTIAHVLSHIARNADGHTRRLDAALRGENLPRYPGGPPQRNSDIAGGSTRSKAEIMDDLRASQARLDQVWEQSATSGWPHRELLGDDHWPTNASPSRRLREVEMHHVDLGIGYEPSDWPDAYVEWELPLMLATVPGRLQGPSDVHQFLAWLSGRGPLPSTVQLGPWS